MYDKILVAVDDSPERETVLGHAASVAKATGGTVHVLHVQTIDTAVMGSVIEEDLETVRTVVKDSVKFLAGQGVTADGEIRETVRPEIARTILEAAKDKKADLLVVGSRRRKGLTGLILGSVADGVAHSAHTPVLLIP